MPNFCPHDSPTLFSPIGALRKNSRYKNPSSWRGEHGEVIDLLFQRLRMRWRVLCSLLDVNRHFETVLRRNIPPTTSILKIKRCNKLASSSKEFWILPAPWWRRVWVTFQLWRCRQYILPRRGLIFHKLYGVISQTIEFFVITVVTISKISKSQDVKKSTSLLP
jgi:hypothetical protein